MDDMPNETIGVPCQNITIRSYAQTQPARAIELINLAINAATECMGISEMKMVGKYLKQRGREMDPPGVPF